MKSKPATFQPLRLRKRTVQGFRYCTSPIRRLPDFLIIGAPRSGTTSLYDYFGRQPEVLPAFRKEVHFFDYNFSRGLSWYRAFFPIVVGNRSDSFTGESTPNYLGHELAPERIKATLPAVPLVAVLRDPVWRAWSDYNRQKNKGLEPLSFPDAIEAELVDRRMISREQSGLQRQGPGQFTPQRRCYLERGEYAKHLLRWFRFFPQPQMFVTASELFWHDTPYWFSRILEHIGLRSLRADNYTYKPVNPTQYENEIPSDLLGFLTDYFSSLNRELFSLLGQEFPWRLPG